MIGNYFRSGKPVKDYEILAIRVCIYLYAGALYKQICNREVVLMQNSKFQPMQFISISFMQNKLKI